MLYLIGISLVGGPEPGLVFGREVAIEFFYDVQVFAFYAIFS